MTGANPKRSGTLAINVDTQAPLPEPSPDDMTGRNKAVYGSALLALVTGGLATMFLV